MKHCPACQSSYPDDYNVCPSHGLGLIDSSLWAAGSIVKEKYRIVRQAGYGGMAVVYEATHIAFDERRALKVMNGNDEEFARRFIREAQLTRRLQHPNAVRVDDIEKAEDGRPFIVMEFIEGPSVKDLIKQGPLPVNRVCDIARQVASALEAAHALGIVHRDIKPTNLMLVDTAAGDHVKVVDFGIARFMKNYKNERHLTLTTLGSVIGTPAYMSPEQAAGRTDDELDGRSDLYSLGVVMYQMLSGDLPIKADSELALLNAQINTPPAPLANRCPELPEPITKLVMSCLNKDRADRPANPGEIGRLLDDWQHPPAETVSMFTGAEPRPPDPVQPQPRNQPPTRVVQPEPSPSVREVRPSTPTIVRPTEEPTEQPAEQPKTEDPPKAPLAARTYTRLKPLYLALGWFAVLLAVEFLARSSSVAPVVALIVPWLLCGISLGALDLLLRPCLGKRTVALSWGAGAASAALFAYLAGPRLGLVWSLFVEWFDVSQSTIHAAFLSCACLLCVLVGNLPLLRKNSKGYVGMLAIFLVISAVELFVHFDFANLALAGALAVFVQQQFNS
jgi:serine/threonine-protein kinase